MRLFLFLLTVVASCLSPNAQTLYETTCADLAAEKGHDAERLNRLFKLDWEHTMLESPEFATYTGYPGQNGRWTDQSLEAIERRKRELRAPLSVLKSIAREKLSSADQLNYDLYRRNISDAIEGLRFPGEYIAVTQLNGIQQDPAQTIETAPHGSVKDYEDILARLRTLPVLIDQNIVLLRKGLEMA